jgi:hypothetical protein
VTGVKPADKQERRLPALALTVLEMLEQFKRIWVLDCSQHIIDVEHGSGLGFFTEYLGICGRLLVYTIDGSCCYQNLLLQQALPKIVGVVN